MRIRKIPKGGGRFRTIYVPSLKEKERLRKLLPTLHEIHPQAVEQHGTRGVAHAFVANRNPVTCALPHRGFQVTVSCDLENWFDTVTDQHLLAAGVPPEIVEAITIPDEHGVRRCRQGLPTSPVAANIAAVKFDAYMLKNLAVLGAGHFAFTRYADDITISLESDVLVTPTLDFIRCGVADQGWTIAEHKTHIQHAKAGRRIIVGIAVDDRVQATRKTRRKLRAARHNTNIANVNGKKLVKIEGINQGAAKSAAGLAEWAACKLPRRARSTRQLAGVLAGGGRGTVKQDLPVPVAAISGSGRRILIEKPAEKIADGSANQ